MDLFLNRDVESGYLELRGKQFVSMCKQNNFFNKIRKDSCHVYNYESCVTKFNV